MPAEAAGSVPRVSHRPMDVGPRRYRWNVTVAVYFVTVWAGWGMKRSDGAKAWSTVLSELAPVRVGGGVGAPDVAGVLAGRPDPGSVDEPGGRVERGPGWVCRCCSRTSGLAAAIPRWRSRWRGWRGGARSTAAARAAIAEVEAFCADTGYPQTRFDAGALAAAELLRRLGHGDVAEMGALLAQAVPPVAPCLLLLLGSGWCLLVVSFVHIMTKYRPCYVNSLNLVSCS